MKLPHDSLFGTVSAGVIITAVLCVLALKLINGV